VYGQHRLLLHRLDRHEAHVGSGYGLAYRLCVGRVVLVALDVRLHELRRYQPNSVTEPLQLSGPMMRTAARLHADQTGRQVGEKDGDLVSPQLLANHDIPSLINPVNLEHVLCQIKANRRNLHVDAPLGSSGR